MNERRRFQRPTVFARGTVGDSAILLILASIQCLCAQVLFFACFPGALATATKDAALLRQEYSLEQRGMVVLAEWRKR